MEIATKRPYPSKINPKIISKAEKFSVPHSALRLAKTENILETFSSGSSSTQLERRRDKLKSQLEEAKYLNTLVENRAQKVLLILQKYFGDLIVSDFKESVQMKLKIIVELKELNDQVCLSKV